MNLGLIWSWELETSLPTGSLSSLVRISEGYVPLSIFTATVLQVEDLSMPKADASTTFPKAPWPSVLPREARVKSEPKVTYDSLHQIRGKHAFSAMQEIQDSSAQAQRRPIVNRSLYHIFAVYGYERYDLYPYDFNAIQYVIEQSRINKSAFSWRQGWIYIYGLRVKTLGIVVLKPRKVEVWVPHRIVEAWSLMNHSHGDRQLRHSGSQNPLILQLLTFIWHKRYNNWNLRW